MIVIDLINSDSSERLLNEFSTEEEAFQWLQASWDMARNGIDGFSGLRVRVLDTVGGDAPLYLGVLGVDPLPTDYLHTK